MSIRHSARIAKDATTLGSVWTAVSDSNPVPETRFGTYRELFEHFGFPLSLLANSPKLDEDVFRWQYNDTIYTEYQWATYYFNSFVDRRFANNYEGSALAKELFDAYGLPYRQNSNFPNNQPPTKPFPQDPMRVPIAPLEKDITGMEWKPVLTLPEYNDTLVRRNIAWYGNIMNLSYKYANKFTIDQAKNAQYNAAMNLFKALLDEPGFICKTKYYADEMYVRANKMLMEIQGNAELLHKARDRFEPFLLQKVLFALRTYINMYNTLFPATCELNTN